MTPREEFIKLSGELHASYELPFISEKYNDLCWNLIEKDFKELYPRKKFSQDKAKELIPEIIKQYVDFYSPTVDREYKECREYRENTKKRLEELAQDIPLTPNSECEFTGIFYRYIYDSRESRSTALHIQTFLQSLNIPHRLHEEIAGGYVNSTPGYAIRVPFDEIDTEILRAKYRQWGECDKSKS